MTDLFVSAVSVIDPNRGQILGGADGKLTPPHNIVTSANGLRSLYQTVFNEGLERIAIWTAIEGLLGGNAPYDQDALDKNGLSASSNFNTLSATSLVNRSINTVWNLTNQAERLAVFEIDYPDDDSTTEAELANYADIMSDQFSKVVREWQNFTGYNGVNCAQLVKFGLSVLLWTDERDWRPRVTQLNKFFVPNQTSSDIDQLTFCFFQNSYTAQYLWQCYERVSNESSAGANKGTLDLNQVGIEGNNDKYKYYWNLDALKQILLFKANSNAKPDAQYMNFYDMEQAFLNSDVGYSNFFGDGIELVSCFYKEYDGMISHYMFDLYLPGQEFVYFYDRQYHDWSEAMAIFTSSPQHSTIHANKGVGQMIFSMAQAVNQLDCTAIDMGRYAGTPMFKNNNLSAVNDPQQLMIFPGAPTNMGNVELMNNTLGANIPGVMQLSQFMEGKLERNNQLSGEDPGVPDRDLGSISPTQARLQTYREFGLMKADISHYYNQLDFVYRTMVSKMLRSKPGYPGYEFAKKWKDKCIKKGVPQEIFDLGGTKWGLPEHLGVRAARVAGDGSTLGELIGLEGMLQLAGDFDPQQKNQFVKDWSRVMLGPDGMKKYATGGGQILSQSVDAGLAQLENNDFARGQQMSGAPGEPKVHFPVHLAFASQVVQARLMDDMTAIQANQIFEPLLPHMSETFELIKRSRFGRTFVAKYQKQWDELKKYAILNKQNAEKETRAQLEQQQRDAAATEQVMSDAQRKDFVAQSDMRRRDFESRNKMARQERESNTRAALEERKIEVNADNARLDANLKAGVAAQKVAADASLNSIEQNRENLQEMYGQTIAPADIEGA